MGIEDLDDALETLKDCLSEGSNAAAAVAETSEEYQINPKLLERKFAERFSVSVAEYLPSVSLKTLDRRRARKQAIEWAWHKSVGLYRGLCTPQRDKEIDQGREGWIEKSVNEDHIGTIFHFEGKEYAFAGLDAWKVCAIPVQDDGGPDGTDDLRWRLGCDRLTFKSKDATYEWLLENTLVKSTEDLI